MNGECRTSSSWQRSRMSRALQPGGGHRRDERAHRAAAVAVDSIPSASSSASAPMCAKPRAPPPERTTPSARPTSRRASRPAPGSLGSVARAGGGRAAGRRRGARGARRRTTGRGPRGRRRGRPRPEAGSPPSRPAASGRPGARRGRSRRRRPPRRRGARARSRPRRCSTALVPAASASSISTEPYAESARASDEATAPSGTPGSSRRRAMSAGRVGRRGKAAARLELRRQLARDRGGEAGSRSISSTKRPRPSWRSVESRTAWTDADRAEPVSSASSPIAAPGPRTRSVRPSASTPATARRRPRRTT